MGKRLAILIAVENYHDKGVKPVPYAEADATGFADALELGGTLDKVFLFSTGATHVSINSQVRQYVKTLTADDELFLFYAGHGFSKNGHNYITCYDTSRTDLENTSIKLKELLDACGASGCRRIAVFLDSCESGITDMPEIRGIYSVLSDQELEDFFKGAGRIVTPDFEYVVDIGQDAEEPSRAIMTRQLLNITPAILGDDGFNEVFEDYFNDLVFTFTASVDVKELIDRIEDMGLKGVDLDYPANCAYVNISIDGDPKEIRVEPHALTMHTPQKSSPKALMDSFFGVQAKLIGSPVVKAITQSTTP